MATLESQAFRHELTLTLGWSREPMTLRQLATATDSTVAKVRYHITRMSARVVVTSDDRGRVLVSLPVPPVDHGTLIWCHDGRAVGPATAAHVERSRRAVVRELRPRSGAPEPGLGVIVVGGFRCWIEPPIAAE
jgi:hypothetical protein